MYIFRSAITFEINSFKELFSSDDSFNDKCTDMKKIISIRICCCMQYLTRFKRQTIIQLWANTMTLIQRQSKEPIKQHFFLFICVVCYFSIAHSPSLLACLLSLFPFDLWLSFLGLSQSLILSLTYKRLFFLQFLYVFVCICHD